MERILTKGYDPVARYDDVQHIELSYQQWADIEEAGRCKHTETRRQQLMFDLVRYANAVAQRPATPNLQDAKAVLAKLERAFRKTARLLHELQKAPEVKNQSPLERRLAQATGDATAKVLRKSLLDMAQGAPLPFTEDGRLDVRRFDDQVYFALEIYADAAKDATTKLETNAGLEKQNTQLRQLMIRTQTIYRESGGNISAHSYQRTDNGETEWSPYVRWIYALCQCAADCIPIPSRHAIAMEARRAIEDGEIEK